MQKGKGPRIADNPSFATLRGELRGAKQLFRLRPLLRFLGVRIDDSMVERFNEISRSLEDLSSLPDRFNDLLIERGWVAYEGLNLNVMRQAIDLGEAGDIGAAEQLLIDHFNERTIEWGIKVMWAVKAFRSRERLARLALEDYLQGRYHACVPVLLIIADGLINEVHGSKGPFTEGIDLTAWDSMAAHDRGLQRLVDLMGKGRKKTTTEPITLPYRHGIIHGRDLGYDNKPIAAKLWAFLFALREWALPSQEGRLAEPPPKPETSLWETVQAYQRGQEEKAGLEAWAPRTEEQLAALPRSGLPGDYQPGSPESAVAELMHLWTRKNYGRMVPLIHLPLEGPLDNRRIGPIAKDLRQIFENKTLRAFRFVEIEDQAAAITRVKVVVEYERDGGTVTKELELGLIFSDERGPALRGKPGGRWTIQNLWSLIP